MISIITSSYNEQFFLAFEKNIEQTIGVPYEIVKIKNVGAMSIAEAYNKGIKKSQYAILCFLHEDVIFKSNNWGGVLIEYFNKIDALGCVGVAGASYKTKVISGWWDAPENEKVVNIVQHATNKLPEHWNFGWDGTEQYKEVSVVDGVFMAVKKTSNFIFDITIPGFHGYDLGLSLESAKKKLKVIVTNEILLEHFSYGSVKKDWFVAVHKLHKKYNSILPLSLNGNRFRKEHEFKTLTFYTYRALEFHLRKLGLYFCCQLFIMKPFSIQNFRILKKILLNN